MKLTDRIKDRVLTYTDNANISLNEMHHELIKDNHNITYEGLRNFVNTDSKGNGNTLNILDEFLTKRGY